MNSKLRRFASLGLYLSLLAALVSAGYYIILRQWNLPLQISLALVVLGLAIFAAFDPDRVRVVITGRQARYGSNALVMTIAFLGILVVINFLVSQYDKRWDLTENKVNTLSPETIDALKKLPQPVVATAFYSTKDLSTRDQVKNLLDQYKFESKGKFTYQFIDPDANPVAAQAANFPQGQAGMIALKMGVQQGSVTQATEQELTSALIRLINPEKRTVYFLIGHGEYSPDVSGDQSYSQLKTTLETKNYTVQTLNLLTTNKIPDDAKVIVVGGPKKPLIAGEVKLIEDYLTKGGSMVVMEDPLPKTEFGNAPDPLADYITKTWGVALGQDLVIDSVGQQLLGQPLVAIGVDYGNHPITDKMQGMATYFPVARSVTSKSVSGISQTQLVKTAQQSWAETDFASLNQGITPQPDPGKDLSGPVPLVIAAEKSDTQARIVVFGNSDFVTDQNIKAGGNSDLMVNSIDWAAKQENLINLTPKQTTNRVIIPPKQYTMNLIFFGSVVILPSFVVVAGGGVWLMRRRRG